MMNIAGATRQYWTYLLVPMGFVMGWYFDKQQDQKLTAFRNKSVLYRRELNPGEEVTWK